MLSQRILPVLLIGVAAICAAQSDQTKPFWVKKYDGINRAFEQKDFKTYEAILDPKFSYVDETGHAYTRSAFLRMKIDPLKSMKKFSGTITVNSLKTTAGLVVVDYTWDYRMTLRDPKRDIGFLGHESAIDTWHKVGGNWLAIKGKLKSSATKMLATSK